MSGAGNALPTQPPAPPKWATEIPGRTPRFKLHSEWSHVRLAVGARDPYGRGGVRGGRIFEWRSEVWVTLWDIPPMTRKSEHEFFLGTRGGPQDITKEALAAERHRKAEIQRLQDQLDRLLQGGAER